MKFEASLLQRSESKCELCKSSENVTLYEVPPQTKSSEENCIMICEKCRAQIEKRENLDSSHWTILSETMWSEVPAVQVMAWRMLNRLRNDSWAMDNLDMLYLDDEKLEWAKATGDQDDDGKLHKDANGNVLQTGDTVVLIKSLDVKGSSLNAKLGTVVRNIRLADDNTDQIEGKIENQLIVILTKYVKKQN